MQLQTSPRMGPISPCNFPYAPAAQLDLVQVGRISVRRSHCGASHPFCGPDALLRWGDFGGHSEGCFSGA